MKNNEIKRAIDYIQQKTSDDCRVFIQNICLNEFDDDDFKLLCKMDQMGYKTRNEFSDMVVLSEPSNNNDVVKWLKQIDEILKNHKYTVTIDLNVLDKKNECHWVEGETHFEDQFVIYVVRIDLIDK